MTVNQPEKLTGTSLDLAAEKRAHLKALFPTVFSESQNAQGEVVEAIDFEKLKAELGSFSELFEGRRERYGMDWPGKKDALRLIQTPSLATLKPCRAESVDFDNSENLFIEGDNLEVLKLLQKSYYGKVKMIYIDPPYNTGKEFIYPDNFTENLQTYLEYAGLVDSDGKKFSTNTANEGRFHTKWLNMMYPRLYLARNLLRDDGVIFISIDDNEVSNLRKLCDEIFGEENFVAQFIWNSSTGGGIRSKYANQNHEYSLCYAKYLEKLPMFYAPLSEEAVSQYNKEDTRGRYREKDFAWKTESTNINQKYGIKSPAGDMLFPKAGYSYRFVEKTFMESLKDDLVVFKKTNTGPLVNEHGETADYNIYIKKYLGNGEGAPTTVLPKSVVGISNIGTEEIKNIFGETIFNNPKSSRYLNYLLTMGAFEDSVILDFFAGSATTAHAVLDLNKDGGNRKFILVQLPEPCAPDSEAYKAGYQTIADIGKERIRRVIHKLNAEQAGKLDFAQAGLQDRGFKVFKLDQSNFKQWHPLPPNTPPADIVQQLELYIDPIRSQATPEDLLYEILLKAGFTPTEKIERKVIAGQQVFAVPGKALLLCLEESVSKALIDAVAEAEPTQFICLDSAFHGDDSLKANAVQTFAARNMQREKHNQIIFRTV